MTLTAASTHFGRDDQAELAWVLDVKSVPGKIFKNVIKRKSVTKVKKKRLKTSNKKRWP